MSFRMTIGDNSTPPEITLAAAQLTNAWVIAMMKEGYSLALYGKNNFEAIHTMFLEFQSLLEVER